MTVRAGVGVGVRSGVRAGVNSALGGLTSPPTSPAEWVILGGPTPTVAHGCQDASGDIADMMGTHDFEVFGTVGYAQAGSGGRDALLLDGACGFRAKNTTIFDPDGATSFSFFLHVNATPTTSAFRSLGGKRISGNLNGYWFRTEVATGLLSGYVEDGVGATFARSSADSVTGAWNPILVVIDRDLDLLRLETPGGTATQDISTIGSMTAAIAYTVGSMNGSNPQNVLVDYHAAWSGAAVTREQYLALGALFA